MACTNCGQVNFSFSKGPAGSAPPDGWAIRALPEEGIALQGIWEKVSEVASSPTQAVGFVQTFLQANGIVVPQTVIEDIGKAQWCDLEPWRCGEGALPNGSRKVKEKIRGARKFWETANILMGVSFNTTPVKTVIEAIFQEADNLVKGPGGCEDCAAAWEQHKLAYPIPAEGTLRDYREYLVLMHNLTRGKKRPVPYRFVAEKFKWKD